jgi:hypothetical protein
MRTAVSRPGLGSWQRLYLHPFGCSGPKIQYHVPINRLDNNRLTRWAPHPIGFSDDRKAICYAAEKVLGAFVTRVPTFPQGALTFLCQDFDKIHYPFEFCSDTEVDSDLRPGFTLSDSTTIAKSPSVFFASAIAGPLTSWIRLNR